MQENLEPGEEEDPLEEAMATHSSILAWRMPMDRGAWQAAVSKITQSQTQQKQLSMHTNFLSHFLNTCWQTTAYSRHCGLNASVHPNVEAETLT